MAALQCLLRKVAASIDLRYRGKEDTDLSVVEDLEVATKQIHLCDNKMEDGRQLCVRGKDVNVEHIRGRYFEAAAGKGRTCLMRRGVTEPEIAGLRSLIRRSMRGMRRGLCIPHAIR